MKPFLVDIEYSAGVPLCAVQGQRCSADGKCFALRFFQREKTFDFVLSGLYRGSGLKVSIFLLPPFRCVLCSSSSCSF